LRPAAAFDVIGHNESKPARVHLEPSRDQVHLLGHAEPVSTDLEQYTLSHERLELSLETRPFLARHPQQLRKFPGRRWMVNAIGDKTKDVVA
jgi:hypothetical protein